MADFLKAKEKVLRIEGGYSNDPMDPGGETYMGISRKYNPDWIGWKNIDACKSFNDFPNVLSASKSLGSLVDELYRTNYWDILSLDKIIDQDLAEAIFDISVNQSPRDAARSAQRAINLVNQNEKLFLDVKVDGMIGDSTVNILNHVPQLNYLIITIKLIQGSEYINECEKNHMQERFFKGWIMQRVVPVIKQMA